MFFSQDWRERIKAENPDAGFGECALVTCLDARLKHPRVLSNCVTDLFPLRL